MTTARDAIGDEIVYANVKVAKSAYDIRAGPLADNDRRGEARELAATNQHRRSDLCARDASTSGSKLMDSQKPQQ